MTLSKLHRSRSQRISNPCFETLEDRRLMSFTPAVNYATTAAPLHIATADFNGDGKLDLATTVGYGSNSKVSVRLGNGAGGFGAAQESAVPLTEYASSLSIADLDNDARPDVVVSDFNGSSTLMGFGNGTFQPAVYAYGASMGYVGHFYNDSTVVGLGTWTGADWETHIQLYFGNGQGDLVAAGQDGYYWGNGAGLVPVDLNNDGRVDVVTGEGLVFMGAGWGLAFDWSQPQPLVGGAAAAAGDFTGDGFADVIVAGNSVAMLRGNGDGTLQLPVHYSTNGTNHSAVATADFNADGKLDAIVTDSALGTVSVMLGNGDGTLRFAGAFATGFSPSSIAVGDFNRDGRPDVAVSQRGQSNFSVLLNDGDWATLPPPPPPPPDLSINDVTVTEGNTGTKSATFTLTLSKPATVQSSVSFYAGGITAFSDIDFDYTGGSVVFAAGETSKTVTVAVRGDQVQEPDETFALSLHSPVNLKIADAQGIGTIVNDDVELPRISINNVSKSEGRSGNTSFTFTVSLSAATNQAVTVNYATANGTAKAGTDYTGKSGMLTFAPGEMSKTITISVKGDRTKESNETFYVDLYGASSNALINVARGTGTILNDDGFFGWRF